jgi:hypothetical protein
VRIEGSVIARTAHGRRQMRAIHDGLRDAGPVPGSDDERQTQSGTPFDPAPQFWVDRLDTEDGSSVVGRCWFGPIRRSMTFDSIATKQGERWDCQPCELRIDAAQVFGRMTDRIDQSYSAKLTLSGPMPAEVGGALLVSLDEPAVGWVLRPNDHTGVGQMWVRELP